MRLLILQVMDLWDTSEMVESSNLLRKQNNLEPIKVILDIFAFSSPWNI